jgi:TRAP-type C4-dicarboxylate transport system substrate-binding protein
LHWRLHKKMELAGYNDFHWLALWALPPYQFHFARPIKNYDSLANLKVRSGGNISTQIIEKLGMTPVSGPVNSAAESLSRQTWDGIFIEWSAGDTFGVHKVAKYHYELDVASIGLGVAMNKQVYESLSAAARKAFDDQSGEALTSGFGKMSDEDRLNVIKRVSEDKDQVIIKPTAAEVERARKALEPITDAWLKSSPRNPPVYEASKQILGDLRK